LDKFSRHVKGVSRKVTVKLEGVEGVDDTLDVKRILNGLAWVSEVQAQGLDQYLLSYPENSIYLANSLSRQPKLRLISYSPYLIRLSYRK
jgi:hypothetical protein